MKHNTVFIFRTINSTNCFYFQNCTYYPDLKKKARKKKQKKLRIEPLKTLLEKEKMLLFSNNIFYAYKKEFLFEVLVMLFHVDNQHFLLFFHSDFFYAFQKKFVFFSYIYFVVYKCFRFGGV